MAFFVVVFFENLTIYGLVESYCPTDHVILEHKPKESPAFQ